MVLTRAPLDASARLRAQNLTALAAAGRKNSAASTRGHTGAEDMRLGALPSIGLVRSLHNFLLELSPRPGAKPDDYMWASTLRQRHGAFGVFPPRGLVFGGGQYPWQREA